MNTRIHSALISVFNKEGLENIIRQLNELGITIYSTGGTQKFIETMNITCIPVEAVTGYPSILGGRVKTLHPNIFGGILGRRDQESDIGEMEEYHIPEIDLVIVDLYPFEETVRSTSDEKLIIEKIDIGGPTMIRAAAKNHQHVVVVAAKEDYGQLEELLISQKGETTLEQRRNFAIKAFDVCTAYDAAISNYFNEVNIETSFNKEKKVLRYGENPHQKAMFYGRLDDLFDQLNGKEISYNNLVDIDASIQLIKEFSETTFAVVKHTNVCCIASRPSVLTAWEAALAGDPESAFGGVLVCNGDIDKATAAAINEIFFEVLIAPSFEKEALLILQSKKNRIILQQKTTPSLSMQSKSLLNGILVQEEDMGNYIDWKEEGGHASSEIQRKDLVFGNIVCKHLKSNAIALVKNRQLIGKGCGQTSRIDALRQALEKARQFKFDLEGAALASDAFFPFDDCVKIAHAAGINSFIQPGGSVRDKESIKYCVENDLVMVMTGTRHFRH